MSTIKEKNINGVPVRVSIIPKGNPKVRPGYAMRAKYITVHTTGNKAKTAGSENHRRYLHRMSTDPFSPYVGYHFVVDDKEIIQLLPISIDGAVGESGWHAGDGSGSKSGNRTSIGIEICENADGDFDKAEDNAKKLISYLMDRCEIPHKNVVPHKHWSNKDCPKPILNRKGGWESFHESILETSSKTSTKSASKTTSINLQSYTVQKDDTLWSISQDYNTTVSKIKKDNDLKDDLIHPGDELMVKSKEKEVEKSNSNEYEGKRVESLLDDLRFYNKPSWEDKDVIGSADKGYGFDIVDKVKVGNGYQYKVKNSKGNIYYITANEKYVKVI